MASSTGSSSSVVPETVLEGFEEFSVANNSLLMALMEEIQEDEQHDDLYYADDDDRLMSMIQSLEAEISCSNSSSGHQRYGGGGGDDIDHDHVGQVDGQEWCTSVDTTNDWMDVEVGSASSSLSPSPFDEEMIMSAWSPYAAGGEDSSDYSEFYYGVLLENYSHSLPQEASDVVF